MRLVEVVPNFSEGRNEKVINAIADAIKSVSGVNLLDVDPGWSTNRTVITFVGEPDAAVEAAFQSIAAAAQLIDMRKHSGEHPRMGATDVCPFVPISGVSMADCAKLAESLGKRVGDELGIPVYLYGEAARKEERRSLADIRKGEYEALPEKMSHSDFVPDFGPSKFNAGAGATVIGARPFLIAYNVNLNTKSKKLANEIALNIREAGRTKKNERGETARGEDGKPIKMAGTLKACRAVGWYVDEYERAQVSINLVDYNETSLHQAFDEVCRQAEQLGLRVTGSEIVGLVPLEPMLMAGRHYLRKQGRSTGVPQSELISVAMQSLGLADLAPFDPTQKIIEFRTKKEGKLLRQMPVSAFLDELSSESAAPGGGSVAALCGALSASLTAMVANLSFEKKGFEEKRPQLNAMADEAQKWKDYLTRLVDEDMLAFNKILEARRMSKGNEAEVAARDQAIVDANKLATDVPLNVLRRGSDLLSLAEQALEKGNSNSLSDTGVAGLTALASAEGAYFNVLINLKGFESGDVYATSTRKEADQLIEEIRKKAENLRTTVISRL